MSDERTEENESTEAQTQPLNTGMAEGLEELEAQAAQIARELQAAGDNVAPANGEESTTEETNTDPKPASDETPTDEKPQGEPPAEDEPKPGDEPKKTETPEEQIKRLKDEIRARDGRHGRDKELWMQQTQALRDELLAAQRQQTTERAAAEAEPTRASASLETESETIPEPTEAQLVQEFGPDYADRWGADHAKNMWILMEKRSRAERRRIKEMVAENVKATEQERAQADRLNRAWADIETEVPGAGDLNASAKVNGFGSYLDGYFGETGFTRRHMAMMARDAIIGGATGAEYAAHKKTLVSIFKGFSSTGDGAPEQPPKPQGTPPKPDKPDPKLYLQPRLAGGDSLPKRGETITQAEADRMLTEASSKGGAEYEKVQRLISKKALAGEIR